MTENGNGNGELRGVALTSQQRRQQERAEREATYAAVGRCVIALAGMVPSGLDELANRASRSDVLKVMTLAGLPTTNLTDQWADTDRKLARQSTTRTGESYEDAPDHDPRVLAVITRPGVTMAEIGRVRQQVASEYAERARQRAQAAADPGRPVAGGVTPGMGQEALFRALQGTGRPHEMPALPLGVRQDPVTGVPVQQTTVDTSVPALGDSEEDRPGTAPPRHRPGCPRASSVPEGARFCPGCGVSVAQVKEAVK